MSHDREECQADDFRPVRSLAGCGGPARAEDPQWLVRDWQTEDDLPDSHVTAIQQTPDGYLWIGTPKGLARFGGVRFKVFPAPGGGSIRALLTSRIHP